MHTTDKKEVDQNSYWFIKNNPLSKVGIFPYLGRQISSELEPDKIYQVLRPEEELSKPETVLCYATTKPYTTESLHQKNTTSPSP